MTRIARGAIVVCATLATTTALAVDWPGRVPSPQERGKDLWERHCVACHGPTAAGDGPLAAALVAPVPDLSEGLRGKDRRALVAKVLRGGGGHPAFEAAFQDFKPFRGDSRQYAENVLDHLERVARDGVPPEPEPEPEPSDEDDDAANDP